MSAKNKNLRRGIQPLSSTSWAPIVLVCLATVLSVDHITAFVPGPSLFCRSQSCKGPVSSILQDALRPCHRLLAKPGDNDQTVMPPRTSKHRVRTKKSKKRQKAASGKAIAQDDLAHHVASLYVMGPGGALHDKKLKAKRLEEQASVLYTNNVGSSHKQQIEYLKKLDRHPALVLNADYQPMSYLPLSMWNWQDAVKGVFSGKVTVVDVYPDVIIRAAHIEIPLPSVIALNDYVPLFNQRPAFTKRNVFLRDEYRCQYCNDPFHTRDLSLDHVVPRCRGGKLNWENAVTSCRKCNGRKGSLPLDQLRSVGMKLARKPFVPTQFQLARVAGRMLPKRVHPTWEPYLGLGGGLQNVSTSRQSEGVSAEGEGEMFFDGA